MSWWDSFTGAISNAASAIISAPSNALGAWTGMGASKTLQPQVTNRNVSNQAVQYTQQSTALAGIKATSAAADVLTTPYRVGVAEPGTAFTLWMQEGRTKPLADYYGMARGDTRKKSWYEGGKGAISLGQSIYGAGSRVFSGNEIDWTDKKAVDKYFSEGAAHWASGTIDAGASLVLDPLIMGGKYAKILRLNKLVQPIKTLDNVEKTSATIQSAINGEKNSWGVIIDHAIENADTPSNIVALNIVKRSTNPEALTYALATAGKTGDRQLVGNVLQAAIGDSKVIENLVAKNDLLSGQIASMEVHLDDINNGLTVAVNEDAIAKIENAVQQLKKQTDILRKIGVRDPDTGKIIHTGLTDSIAGQTVAKSARIEAMRARNAITSMKTLYGEETNVVNGLTVRTLHWFNPSSTIKETPSGLVNLGNISASESYKEMVAITRNVASRSGKDYRKFLDEYLLIPTKEKKFDFLDGFEKTALEDIIVKKVFNVRPEDLNEVTLDAVRMLVEKLVTRKNRAYSSVMSDVVKRNFIFVDDTGVAADLGQFKTFLEQQAIQNGTTFEKLAEDMIANPQFASQQASVYHMPDFGIYDNILEENKALIRHVVDNLVLELGVTSGKPLSAVEKDLLKTNISRLIERAFENPSSQLSKAEKASSKGKELFDLTVHLSDEFHSNIWKPITLISGKYGLRNVIEGTVFRVPVALNELHDLTGVSRKDIFKDFFNIGKEDEATIMSNLKARIAARGNRKELEKHSLSLATAADASQAQVVLSTRTLESVMGNLKGLASKISTLKDPTGKLQQQINNWLQNGSGIISKIKNSEARRFVIMLIDGDVDKAILLLSNSNDVATMTRHLADFGDDLLKMADDFEQPLLNGYYDNYLAKHSVQLIKDYQDSLIAAYKQINTVIGTKITRDAAFGKFESLMAGATPLLRKKGEGVFEVLPGTHLPAEFEGQLGMFARGESSADKNLANTILAGNRTIGQDVFARMKKNIEVKPNDENWVKSAHAFLIGDLRSDTLNYKILQGKTDKELRTWLLSDASRDFREATRVNGHAMGGKLIRQDIEDLIQTRRYLIERHVPEIDGLKPNYLREKVLDGTLTDSDVALIPMESRATVSGYDFANTSHFADLNMRYKARVAKFFKYVGSLPETVLSRHPFYRTVYRTESRRLATILKDAGKDLESPEIIDRIQRSSHRRAMKTLNESLYTIERRSEPAQLMRFISPFYMAQQNSTRFWFGNYFRNPALPFIQLHLWNSAGKLLDVRDSDGNPIESSLPWNSNETIYINLPKPVADFFNFDPKQSLALSKTSFDLVSNGAMPFIPSLSGPMVNVAASAIFDSTPILSAATDLGLDGNAIEKYVFPYFNASRSDFVSEIAPLPSWLNSLRNAYFMTPQRASRTELIAQQMFYELDVQGKVLTPKLVSKTLKEAGDRAKNSYLLESVFGQVSPFSTKVTVDMDLMRKQWRRYITRFGNVDGPVKFEKDYGMTAKVFASQSLSNNPAGLIATPQTLRNIEEHKGLAEEIAAMTATAGDESFGLLGIMFNEGGPKDFSSVVNQKYYDMKIGSRDVKSLQDDPAVAAQKRQLNEAWSIWIPFKNSITAKAELNGVKVNSKEWDATYKPLLDTASSYIAQRFPVWGNNKGKTNPNSDFINFYTLQYAYYSGSRIDKNTGKLVWAKDSFKATVGRRNPLWKAISQWITVRNTLSSVLQDRVASGGSENLNANSNSDIANALQVSATVISSMYPEFANVYERYLANDTLKYIPQPSALTRSGK